jgi:hypothetical protein
LLHEAFNELAWSNKHSELARLIRREDISRKPHRLPRPLTAEQDQLLQQKFLRRRNLGGNAFLLIRHTGMRISECVDLSCDCLCSTGLTNERFMFHSASLKQNARSPSMLPRVNAFNAFDSFAPWILCLTMDAPGAYKQQTCDRSSTARLPARGLLFA